MEQKQSKAKIIYSKNVCEQLMLLGFRPIETIPNPIKQEFVCWVFERDEEFDKALDIILTNYKGGARNG